MPGRQRGGWLLGEHPRQPDPAKGDERSVDQRRRQGIQACPREVSCIDSGVLGIQVRPPTHLIPRISTLNQ